MVNETANKAMSINAQTDQNWRVFKRKKDVMMGWTSALVMAGFSSTIAAGSAHAGVDVGDVVSGVDGISQIGNAAGGIDTTINQTANIGIVEFNEFNVGAADHVNIIQRATTDTFIADIQDRNASVIDGRISALGRVVLLNDSGIIFSEGSSVNVGSLLASTASDYAINGDQVRFSGDGEGFIVNKGNIAVSEGGFGVLIAPNVTNEGIINAPVGQVELGSSDNFTLDLRGDGLITYNVSEEQLRDAGIRNAGQIIARSGVVTLNAKQAKAVVDSTINLDGVIDASAFSDAHDGGRVLVAANGDLNFNSTTILADGGTFGDGGEIITRAGGTNNFSVDASFSAQGGSQLGDGGFIDVSGNALLFGGSVDTTAANGAGGTVLIDPEEIRIRDGAGASTENVIFEQTIENLSQAGNNVVVEADERVILENLADDELTGGNGGITLRGLNATSTVTFEDTNDTISTREGNIVVEGGSINIGNLETGGDINSIPVGDDGVGIDAGDITVSAVNGDVRTGDLTIEGTRTKFRQEDIDAGLEFPTTRLDVNANGGEVVIDGDASITIIDRQEEGGDPDARIRIAADNDVTIDGDVTVLARDRQSTSRLAIATIDIRAGNDGVATILDDVNTHENNAANVNINGAVVTEADANFVDTSEFSFTTARIQITSPQDVIVDGDVQALATGSNDPWSKITINNGDEANITGDVIQDVLNDGPGDLSFALFDVNGNLRITGNADGDSNITTPGDVEVSGDLTFETGNGDTEQETLDIDANDLEVEGDINTTIGDIDVDVTEDIDIGGINSDATQGGDTLDPNAEDAGDVALTAGGDVTVGDINIEGNDGDSTLDVDAGGDVNLGDVLVSVEDLIDDVEADGDIVADVDVDAGGDIVTGDVTSEATDVIAGDGTVDATAGVDLDAGNNENDADVTTGDITVAAEGEDDGDVVADLDLNSPDDVTVGDVTVSADGGGNNNADTTITSVDDLTIGDSVVVTSETDDPDGVENADLTINADEVVIVEDGDQQAVISADDDVTINGDVIFQTENNNTGVGELDIVAGDTLDVNGDINTNLGDLDIQAGAGGVNIEDIFSGVEDLGDLAVNDAPVDAGDVTIATNNGGDVNVNDITIRGTDGDADITIDGDDDVAINNITIELEEVTDTGVANNTTTVNVDADGALNIAGDVNVSSIDERGDNQDTTAVVNLEAGIVDNADLTLGGDVTVNANAGNGTGIANLDLNASADVLGNDATVTADGDAGALADFDSAANNVVLDDVTLTSNSDAIANSVLDVDATNDVTIDNVDLNATSANNDAVVQAQIDAAQNVDINVVDVDINAGDDGLGDIDVAAGNNALIDDIFGDVIAGDTAQIDLDVNATVDAIFDTIDVVANGANQADAQVDVAAANNDVIVNTEVEVDAISANGDATTDVAFTALDDLLLEIFDIAANGGNNGNVDIDLNAGDATTNGSVQVAALDIDNIGVAGAATTDIDINGDVDVAVGGADIDTQADGNATTNVTINAGDDVFTTGEDLGNNNGFGNGTVDIDTVSTNGIATTDVDVDAGDNAILGNTDITSDGDQAANAELTVDAVDDVSVEGTTTVTSNSDNGDAVTNITLTSTGDDVIVEDDLTGNATGVDNADTTILIDAADDVAIDDVVANANTTNPDGEADATIEIRFDGQIVFNGENDPTSNANDATEESRVTDTTSDGDDDAVIIIVDEDADNDGGNGEDDDDGTNEDNDNGDDNDNVDDNDSGDDGDGDNGDGDDNDGGNDGDDDSDGDNGLPVDDDGGDGGDGDGDDGDDDIDDDLVEVISGDEGAGGLDLGLGGLGDIETAAGGSFCDVVNTNNELTDAEREHLEELCELEQGGLLGAASPAAGPQQQRVDTPSGTFLTPLSGAAMFGTPSDITGLQSTAPVVTELRTTRTTLITEPEGGTVIQPQSPEVTSVIVGGNPDTSGVRTVVVPGEVRTDTNELVTVGDVINNSDRQRVIINDGPVAERRAEFINELEDGEDLGNLETAAGGEGQPREFCDVVNNYKQAFDPAFVDLCDKDDLDDF